VAKKGGAFILGLALFSFGATAFYHGLKHYALKKAIQYTPTSKAVSAVPGLTEVAGVARTFKEKKLSPYAQKECLYCETEIWKWSGSGKSRKKRLEKKFQSDQPILVEDDTGKILVKPTFFPSSSKSEVCLKRDVSASGIPSGGIIRGLFADQDSGDKLAQFLYRFCPELSGYGDRVEVYETYIQDGDQIYVLGKAEIYDPNESTPRLIIKDEKKVGYFCISDGAERDALSRVGSWLNTSIFGGPILAFLGFEISSAGLYELGVPSSLIMQLVQIGFAIPVILYAWLTWTWLLAVYNGLVLLKNQIDRARANVGTFLVKRHDLVPNLVKVVQEYAKYEKGMQEMITSLRVAKVGESEKILFAISENYPDLKANENFLELQKELVSLENQIAGSREYFNDAVMLYNRQIASFPHLIVARAMKLKSIEYYAISEEAARAPVEVGGG
jgi:LemA protein